jgi:hypothetical protein
VGERPSIQSERVLEHPVTTAACDVIGPQDCCDRRGWPVPTQMVKGLPVRDSYLRLLRELEAGSVEIKESVQTPPLGPNRARKSPNNCFLAWRAGVLRTNGSVATPSSSRRKWKPMIASSRVGLDQAIEREAL